MKRGEAIYHWFMPYCLRKLSDGRWLLLNRQYKPVGFTSNEHVDYEALPVSAAIRFSAPLRAATIQKLSIHGEISKGPEGTEFIFLYDDKRSPRTDMKGYLARLDRLAGLQVHAPA